MNYYSTCRFCKKASFETPKQVMVKYGVRHWSHPECGIERFGAEQFFRKLHTHQVSALPWQLVEQHQDALLAAHPTIEFADELRKLKRSA